MCFFFFFKVLVPEFFIASNRTVVFGREGRGERRGGVGIGEKETNYSGEWWLGDSVVGGGERTVGP